MGFSAFIIYNNGFGSVYNGVFIFILFFKHCYKILIDHLFNSMSVSQIFKYLEIYIHNSLLFVMYVQYTYV